MADQQIVREYDPQLGRWLTRAQPEPAAGTTPDLAAVLAEGNDADGAAVTGLGGLAVTGPVSFDLSEADDGFSFGDLQQGYGWFFGKDGSVSAFGSPLEGGIMFRLQPSPEAGTFFEVKSGNGSNTMLVMEQDANGARGDIEINAGASLFLNADSLELGGAGTTRVRVPSTSTLVIADITAPADGDLSASQMSIWFDRTNGSAKLMVKAKQQDGTVVTGEVALAA